MQVNSSDLRQAGGGVSIQHAGPPASLAGAMYI